MAERPVFVPLASGARLVSEVPVAFSWNPGMAPSQKKKNVAALHEAAAERGLPHLLEISSKSDREIGRRLSAFHQKLEVDGKAVSLEAAYQASKVFAFGGPYRDLLSVGPRQAKQDPRLHESGHLLRFEFEGDLFPLTPATSFYDWLYARALFPEREWLRRLGKMDGFTDIEFNPARSLNCQARSCAMFVALERRGLLDEAMSSFDRFTSLTSAASI